MITPEGDFLSNVMAPDLRPFFKHLHWRVMPHSQGHLVASDWADQDETGEFAFYKNCGLWTRDEAAILFNIAREVRGRWVDIGCHTGWTSKHINWASNSDVACVDPMLSVYPFLERFRQNTGFPSAWQFKSIANEFFKAIGNTTWDAFCIDGDHEPGKPLEDARNALAHLRWVGRGIGGVIVFHDFVGQPVQEAVTWLLDTGIFNARIYDTPHGVACCWLKDAHFMPPIHVPDPRVPWAEFRKSRNVYPDFDFSRCL